jgi:hypothetical protein
MVVVNTLLFRLLLAVCSFSHRFLPAESGGCLMPMIMCKYLFTSPYIDPAYIPVVA